MTTIDSFLEAPAGTVAVLSRDGQRQAVAISKSFGGEVRFSLSNYTGEGMGVVQQYAAEDNARLEILGAEHQVIATSEKRDELTSTEGGYNQFHREITTWLREQPEGTVIFEGRSDTEYADFSVGLKLNDGTWNSTGCDFYGADEINEAFELPDLSASDFDFELLPSRVEWL